MAGHEIVLPGQGWRLSRVRATGEPGAEPVVEHHVIVGWAYAGMAVGMAPLTVMDGGTTATVVKNPFRGEGTDAVLVWHPDVLSTEQVEQMLMTRAKEGT